MKKKVVAACMTVALAAVAMGGATLAYFTDTETETNTFVVGEVDIELNEDFPDNNLVPGDKTHNNLKKEVTVENVGENEAYMWIEVWVPASLDDGDDNSPAAPGLGNSLHFNYAKGVVETKATYLGSKDGYNGYVHYIPSTAGIAKGGSTAALLDQVYMDKLCTQCTDTTHSNCMVLMDGETHYTGVWDLKINAIGFQAEGFGNITDAISEYYGKDVTAYIW